MNYKIKFVRQGQELDKLVVEFLDKHRPGGNFKITGRPEFWNDGTEAFLESLRLRLCGAGMLDAADSLEGQAKMAVFELSIKVFALLRPTRDGGMSLVPGISIPFPAWQHVECAGDTAAYSRGASDFLGYWFARGFIYAEKYRRRADDYGSDADDPTASIRGLLEAAIETLNALEVSALGLSSPAPAAPTAKQILENWRPPHGQTVH